MNKDITFCVNHKCQNRGLCLRAIENYSEEEVRDYLISMASFNCDVDNKYIPIRSEV